MRTPRALPCALLTLLLAPLGTLDGQERAVLIKTPEAKAAPEAETPTPDADQAPSGGVDESIVITEVLLDALVTDRQGNVIIGLEADDFIVEEAGKAVDLVSVEFYSPRRNLDATSEAPQGQPLPTRRRYFMVLFHDKTHNDPRARERLMQSSRDVSEWIQKQLSPTDLVAITSFDFKLKIHQDFTSDVEALLTGVKNAAAGKDPGGNWPSRMPEQAMSDVPSLLANLPRGNELRKAADVFPEALMILGGATKTIGARKTVFLLSTGFEGANVGPWRPDRRYYPPMIETRNDSNVAVYTFDLSRPGVDSNLHDSLSSLAFDTGGRLFDNLVSFQKPLEIVADENSGYYLLSYRSTSPKGKSGYRKVKVKVKNREFRVTGRRGYLYGS